MQLGPAPETMIAAQGKAYGDIDEMITVENSVPVPKLSDLPKKQRKDWAIVRTLAVALAPGDCRVLSGYTSPLQGPPSFPYVPGGDLCGIVEDLPPDAPPNLPFKVGDRVAVMFQDGPARALGEQAAIKTAVCDIVPDNVTDEGAAALGSSGMAAVAVADRINESDRVLILGAGGGVGSHLCQLARLKGASYVAGVARDADRLLKEPLSVDRAIDYTKEDPWSETEWLESPFDIVVDLSSGEWLKLLERYRTGGKKALIVKPAKEGGRFLTLSPDEPVFHAHSMWKMLKVFAFPAIRRALRTRTLSRAGLPKFSLVIALSESRENLSRALALAGEGKLVPCIDPEGTFPLTTEGVRKAFRLQESRHVKGKVVVQVAADKK